jgi:hypothetical protein
VTLGQVFSEYFGFPCQSSFHQMLHHHNHPGQVQFSGRRAEWTQFGIKKNNLVAGFPPRRPGFEPRSSRVGFVVDKVALGQVFSEYFGFPCQFSFHRLLNNHHLSSGTGTRSQSVADVPSGLSLTPPQEIKKKRVDDSD